MVSTWSGLSRPNAAAQFAHHADKMGSSLDVIAALVLAEIHGRCGHFPAVVRMRRDQTGAAPVFQVTEIIDLQTLRDEARRERETA